MKTEMTWSVEPNCESNNYTSQGHALFLQMQSTVILPTTSIHSKENFLFVHNLYAFFVSHIFV